MSTLLDLYFKDKYELFEPLLAMSLHGVRQDEEKRKATYDTLKEECLKLRDSLEQYNDGQPLYKLTTKRDRAVWQYLADIGPPFPDADGKTLIQKTKNTYYKWQEVAKSIDTIASKSISDQELGKLLHSKYKLPKIMRRRNNGTKTMSLDETALRTLRLRFGRKSPEAVRVIETVLAFRKKEKLATFLTEGKADEDGRLRCTYKFTTETGRLASAKNPKGTGYNLQNVHRGARSVFIPDEGCVFLEVDLSQAESRVVGALTRDDRLIELARTMPWEFDVHRYNAGLIFHISEDDVTYDQRYLAKRAVHASNYGMAGKRLADLLLNEDVVITAEECQRMIDTYMARFPAIRDWQRRVRQQVMRYRTLTNSWGARWSVPYERLDDNLYRRAYAWVPQGEVGRLTNRWGLVPLYKAFKTNSIGEHAHINLQVHDSLLISTPPEYAYAIAALLNRHLFRPRSYQGVEVAIPCEFKLGMDWSFKGGQEFKKLPSKEEFTDAAYAIHRGEM